MSSIFMFPYCTNICEILQHSAHRFIMTIICAVKTNSPIILLQYFLIVALVWEFLYSTIVAYIRLINFSGISVNSFEQYMWNIPIITKSFLWAWGIFWYTYMISKRLKKSKLLTTRLVFWLTSFNVPVSRKVYHYFCSSCNNYYPGKHSPYSQWLYWKIKAFMYNWGTSLQWKLHGCSEFS